MSTFTFDTYIHTYMLMTLTNFYLSKVLNTGFFLAVEYFHTVVLVLLLIKKGLNTSSTTCHTQKFVQDMNSGIH